MKKILSIILVLSMLLTSCLLLISCSKVSVKDVEKDAYTTISAAMQNTSESFFEKNADAEKALEKALKCGAFTLSFESDELMGGDLTKISETFYVDSKNEKFVSDTSVTYNGKALCALLFLDEAGLKLKSQSILGSDKALAINVSSIKENLKGSTLAEILGLTDEDVAEIIEVINNIESELKSNSEENLEKAKEFYNELYALCGQTVTEEKIEKDKYVVVTYTINNEAIKAIINKYVEFMSEYYPEDMTEDLEEEIDAAIAEIDETVDVAINAKLYINRKANEITKITFDGSFTSFSNEKAEINAEISFSETEIKATASASLPSEESMSAEMLIQKEKKDGNTTYTLSIDAKTGSVQIDLLNASYTSAKDGSITVKADIYSDVYDRMTFELKGKLTSAKNEMNLEFSSLKLNDETYTFKATFSAKAMSEIIASPSDAKDVMELTEDEWMEIAEEIQNSELGKIISDMTPSYPGYDYYY